MSVKFPLRDSMGTIYAVCGISTDITGRKRAEAEREQLLAEVQRRGAELDSSLTSIADGIMIYNATGEITRMNPAAEKILCYPPETRTLPLPERLATLRVVTPDGAPFPLQEIPSERALRGETVRGVILVVHRPTIGDAIWVLCSAAPIRAPDGSRLGAVAVLTDVTAQHELQERLQDLIRTISHDLRTPLVVIQGQAQLLVRALEKAGMTGRERVSAEAIVTGSKRMNAMISDLIDSTRLETGQLQLDTQPIDLDGFVSELLDRISAAQETLLCKRSSA